MDEPGERRARFIMASRYNVVITAGGRIDGAFASRARTEIKALAPIRSSSPLASVIAAARGAGLERIAVVGDDRVHAACSRDVERVIPDSGSGAGNVLAALRAWPQDEPLLYLTSDMPYIDASHLVDVMQRCDPDTVSMPVISLDAYQTRFPQAPSAGITLRGTTVINGGLFMLPAGASARIEVLAPAFFNARKSPLQMARLIGLPCVLAYLARRLDISALEKRAQKILGMPVAVLSEAAPELGFDIDDLEHYAYACAHE